MVARASARAGTQARRARAGRRPVPAAAAAAAGVAVLMALVLLTPDARAGLARDARVSAQAASPAVAAVSAEQVTLAFAGDVHFAGASRAALSGDLGTAGAVLARADLAVVNLETAVTSRGTPEPKEYVFRAPATAFLALRRAGVDVVSMANNHGMDYGRVGLADSLAAARRYAVPVIGAGRDVTSAYAPFRTTIKGVRISVLAATDVLDEFAIPTWPATARRSGLASAKDPTRLLAAVRAEAKRADVVAVVLHWGVELQACPTARQRQLARLLTRAGAQIVVGSHAHVLLPQVQVGRSVVHYGLGNFVFYATGAQTVQTGVLTVTVDGDGVQGTQWSPAVIREGRPSLLTGAAAERALERQDDSVQRCGLA